MLELENLLMTDDDSNCNSDYGGRSGGGDDVDSKNDNDLIILI
jgi:hypothetical protein